MNYFRTFVVGGGLSALMIAALSVVSLERQRAVRASGLKAARQIPLDVEITTSITPKDPTGAVRQRGARLDRRRLEALAADASTERDRLR